MRTYFSLGIFLVSTLLFSCNGNGRDGADDGDAVDQEIDEADRAEEAVEDVEEEDTHDVPEELPCTDDDACADEDPCTDEYCDLDTGQCMYPLRDQDEDGYVDAECGGNDCDDTDEGIRPGTFEICNDGADNDCDGRTDCQEAECLGTEGCPCGESELTCDDEVDNDCDTMVDCADDDCADPCACAEEGSEDACDPDLRCCSDGCCNTLSDPGCCGGCGYVCPEGSDLCCSGICASCCNNEDCDDVNHCTENICSAGSCSNPPLPDGTDCGGGFMCCSGVCVECCEDSDCDDANECTTDSCTGGTCSNTRVADRTECTGGLCCEGVCRSGANCCSDADCTGGCTGSARDCSVLDETACETQVGCSWAPGPCTGTPAACATHTIQGECEVCSCTWDSVSGTCSGTAAACDTYDNDFVCNACGCTPGTGGPCSGTHEACTTYPDFYQCNSQLDCSWSVCDSYTCT